MWEAKVPSGRTLLLCQKHAIILLPSSKNVWPVLRAIANLGKENKQTIHGLLVTDSELTLIPGDTKAYSGPVLRIGAYAS